MGSGEEDVSCKSSPAATSSEVQSDENGQYTHAHILCVCMCVCVSKSVYNCVYQTLYKFSVFLLRPFLTLQGKSWGWRNSSVVEVLATQA